MSVTVTLRHPFSTETPTPISHPKGTATLVDGRGNLLILDAADLDLLAERDENGRALFGKAESTLIKHIVATYAEGEWSHAEVDPA